jgi:hypothetical protein
MNQSTREIETLFLKNNAGPAASEGVLNTLSDLSLTVGSILGYDA